MDDSKPILIPAEKTYSSAEIVYYARPLERTLDEAIVEADLLVSCPHSGAAIPAELSEFLAPEFTRRLQYDFSDQSTSAVVRRWAEIDPRIVYVENPHPRMIRDPNREKPSDLRATLKEAFARIAAAGPGVHTDLTGVDAVRPVTFSFFPLLIPPTTEAELTRMADTFTAVAERGLGVYERTRDDLIKKFVAVKLQRKSAHKSLARFTTLSFHDTMNHTTKRDGAVNVKRPAADRLPAIVALSNRGDHNGDPRGNNPVTMAPTSIRQLARAHRSGFHAPNSNGVALNQPYLGSYEIIKAGALFDELHERATGAGLELAAVQAEFLREFLLGEANTAVLQQPGTGWVEPDRTHVEDLAQACKASWDIFRSFKNDEEHRLNR